MLLVNQHSREREVNKYSYCVLFFLTIKVTASFSCSWAWGITSVPCPHWFFHVGVCRVTLIWATPPLLSGLHFGALGAGAGTLQRDRYVSVLRTQELKADSLLMALEGVPFWGEIILVGEERWDKFSPNFSVTLQQFYLTGSSGTTAMCQPL